MYKLRYYLKKNLSLFIGSTIITLIILLNLQNLNLSFSTFLKKMEFHNLFFLSVLLSMLFILIYSIIRTFLIKDYQIYILTTSKLFYKILNIMAFIFFFFISFIKLKYEFFEIHEIKELLNSSWLIFGIIITIFIFNTSLTNKKMIDEKIEVENNDLKFPLKRSFNLELYFKKQLLNSIIINLISLSIATQQIFTKQNLKAGFHYTVFSLLYSLYIIANFLFEIRFTLFNKYDEMKFEKESIDREKKQIKEFFITSEKNQKINNRIISFSKDKAMILPKDFLNKTAEKIKNDEFKSNLNFHKAVFSLIKNINEYDFLLNAMLQLRENDYVNDITTLIEIEKTQSRINSNIKKRKKIQKNINKFL